MRFTWFFQKVSYGAQFEQYCVMRSRVWFDLVHKWVFIHWLIPIFLYNLVMFGCAALVHIFDGHVYLLKEHWYHPESQVAFKVQCHLLNLIVTILNELSLGNNMTHDHRSVVTSMSLVSMLTKPICVAVMVMGVHQRHIGIVSKVIPNPGWYYVGD